MNYVGNKMIKSFDSKFMFIYDNWIEMVGDKLLIKIKFSQSPTMSKNCKSCNHSLNLAWKKEEKARNSTSKNNSIVLRFM